MFQAAFPSIRLIDFMLIFPDTWNVVLLRNEQLFKTFVILLCQFLFWKWQADSLLLAKMIIGNMNRQWKIDVFYNRIMFPKSKKS